mgnify:CR=1 FL=1
MAAAAGQQYHEPLIRPSVIDPVSRAVVQPQFVQPPTQRLAVTGVAERQPVQARQHTQQRLRVAALEAVQPRLKRIESIDGKVVSQNDHGTKVAFRLQLLSTSVCRYRAINPAGALSA